MAQEVTRRRAFWQDQTGQCRRPPSLFGDFVILLFITVQVLDGVLTYVGIQIFGRSVEANPLLYWLMQLLGDGPGLAMAKTVALGLGAFLHLASVDRAVALLVAIYLTAAVGPWTHLLFFYR